MTPRMIQTAPMAVGLNEEPSLSSSTAPRTVAGSQVSGFGRGIPMEFGVGRAGDWRQTTPSSFAQLSGYRVL